MTKIHEHRKSPPSIAFLMGIGAILLVVGAPALAAIGFWSLHQLRQATGAEVRAERSLILADELERTVLVHARLSNLYLLTREEDVRQRRVQLSGAADQLIVTLKPLSDNKAERDLIDVIEQEIQEWMNQRRLLDEEGADVERAIKSTRRRFGHLLRQLSTLRAMNEAQVEEAAARASRVQRVAEGVSTGAVVTTFALLVLVGYVVRRGILLPLLDLHRTTLLLREGDAEARCKESGLREVAEVCDAFNDLATSLESQRDMQISFLAAIAHDLRNPLSALSLASRSLANGLPPDRQKKVVEMLIRQTDHLARMVNDFADITTLEAGKLEFQRTPVNLQTSIAQVVELYSPTTDLHDLVVQCQDCPLEIVADPLRVEQIISNLVSNAIKYSPDGGNVIIGLRERAGAAELSVEDTGIGIPAAEIAKIFRPFRRIRPDVAQGTGLGLSTVRRIVVGHGGTIQVSSEPGRGTKVVVTLPVGHALACPTS
ncbi:hypothetical protein BH23VER1_BH23VER1_29910 [soil metagenome]